MQVVTRIIWQNKSGKVTTRFVTKWPTYEKSDKVGQRLGWGKTLLIDSPMDGPSLSSWIKGAIADFQCGLYWKFAQGYPLPLCCITQFCLDTLLGRLNTAYRWREGIDHVPCRIHLMLMGGRQNIPDDEW